MTDASGQDPGEADQPDVPLTRRDAAEARRSVPAAAEPTAAFQAHVRAARSEFESQVAHARAEFEEANERIKERTGRDLLLATVIGLAIGAVLILSLIFVKWAFVVFALGAALLGIFEFSRALVASGRRVDLVPQLVVATGLILTAAFLDLWLHWVALFVAVAFVVVWRLVAQMAAHDARRYGDVLSDVLVASLIQLYVAFLASMCVVLLRQDGGEWWVLAFIIVAVASDTGAYAAGIMFGRHPMAPRISPKKTWEGFAGAVVAAMIAGVLLGLFMLGIPWWTGVIFGIVILVTATAGDLGESMIKRDLGIKDMSSWLPGHGGVLDRLDSILPSATGALALYYLFTPLVA
ncbi:phosphatidate cytidylyltransferase [Microbacterium sp. 2FI]|uniref:phosphatidate cytidylyltransferase n=1 Tax=Microbacterium sp. 2FI TaxID=2502193 RepID=UPI0010F6E0EE|nr:phosphatidate cytidylyltransferase [Microbacterium sp. 2FI]